MWKFQELTLGFFFHENFPFFFSYGCCLFCCCCKDQLPPKAKQLKSALESIETYRAQQLEKLRDNYAQQVNDRNIFYYFKKLHLIIYLKPAQSLVSSSRREHFC